MVVQAGRHPGLEDAGARRKDPERDDDADRSRHEAKAKPPVAVKIDFDGIERRVMRLPVEPDNLADLVACEDTLLYQKSGAGYYGRESEPKTAVMAYSLKDRDTKTVAEEVSEWSASGDCKHVFAQLAGKETKLFEVGGKAEDAKSVALAGLVVPPLRFLASASVTPSPICATTRPHWDRRRQDASQ